MAGINVDGNTELTGYTVVEDATPTDPSNISSGYGQITYSTNKELPYLSNDILLSDPMRGRMKGIVSGMTGTDGLVQITADSALAKLNKWYTIPPYSGTLQGYLTHIQTYCGVDMPMVTGLTRTVKAPGFVGNVWDGFKKFLVANQLEVAQVAERIVVRELRTMTTYDRERTTEMWEVNSAASAEWINVFWYDCTDIQNNVELFPFVQEEEFQPISVGAGETVIQDIEIPGSVSKVNQPQCLDYVAANTDYTGSNGAYCVSGNDGKPILASRWKAGGGGLQVALTDDPSVIRVIVTGSIAEEYAPYRIAATAGTSSYYNSLHITGTGMRWQKNSVLVHSGAPRSATAAETKVDIDNVNITSLAQAYTMAMAAAKGQSGGKLNYSGTATSLNRPDNRSGEILPRIKDFNDAYPNGLTIEQFNELYERKTFKDFNDEWKGFLEDELVNQAFGNVIGARARREDAFFRITSTTTTPNNVQYQMEIDTTIKDFNDVHPEGMTIKEFNELYAGYRFIDFNERPLRVSK